MISKSHNPAPSRARAASDVGGVQELIERLEKLAGPDRQIDGLIERAIAGDGPYHSTMTPYYSSSIDAALTLVEEGWFCQLTIKGSKAWAQLCSDPNDDYAPFFFSSEKPERQFGTRQKDRTPRPTPAIALCIAALKARLAVAQANDPSVKEWLEQMSAAAMLPVKRSGPARKKGKP